MTHDDRVSDAHFDSAPGHAAPATGVAVAPDVLRPAAGWELIGLLRRSLEDSQRIAIVGGGSKAHIGPTPDADLVIDITNLRGIIDVDPVARLVRVHAGTRIRALEQELVRQGFMLCFEALDFGALFGGEPWQGTVGGSVASNLVGSRQLISGDMTRNVVSAQLVTGRAQTLTLGGGARHAPRSPDILASLAGSWGRFGIITEVGLRIEPLPEETLSVAVFGLDHRLASSALAELAANVPGLTGALHIDDALLPRLWSERVRDLPGSMTVGRIEGRSRALPQLLERARRILDIYAPSEILSDLDSTALWSELQSLSPFEAGSGALWRIVIPARFACEVVDILKTRVGGDVMIDCAGAVVWFETIEPPDATASDIRRVLASFGGQATLIRASADVRARVDSFHPTEPPLDWVVGALKAHFDPDGLINRGRVHADL